MEKVATNSSSRNCTIYEDISVNYTFRRCSTPLLGSSGLQQVKIHSPSRTQPEITGQS